MEIEEQADLCLDLVDVLPSRSRAAGKLETEVILVNPEVIVDPKHGSSMSETCFVVIIE
jgi:hypothetical protein